MSNFKLVNGLDLKDKLIESLTAENSGRGISTGIEKLDKYYTMKPGSCTDWTGYPTSGKTELLLECLINSAQSDNLKHMLYMPDVGDDTTLVKILSEKFLFKRYEGRFGNQPTPEQIEESLEFIQKHFVMLTRRVSNAKLSPEYFWNMALKFQDKHGVKIDSCVIDSWKDMRHDYSMRDDKYLEHILSVRNAIAEDNQIHIHTVIHPPKPMPNQNGEYPIPDPYKMKGGSEWYNSGKSIIVVHRPDKETNEALVRICKAKPREVGELGDCMLKFDVAKSRYYYEDDYQKKMYAFGITFGEKHFEMPRDESFDEKPQPIQKIIDEDLDKPPF